MQFEKALFPIEILLVLNDMFSILVQEQNALVPIEILFASILKSVIALLS